MAHFQVNDDGEFELQGYGEGTEELVFRRGYPVLGRAFEEKGDIKEAVKTERDRLWPKEGATNRGPQPETQLGRNLKAATDMPTKMLDRMIKRETSRTLKRFKGHGKPN